MSVFNSASGIMLTVIVLILISTILMTIWTYRDAKIRNNNEAMIWALVVFVLPNYLGLVAYLIVSRILKREEVDEEELNKNNKLLIISLVLVILMNIVLPTVSMGHMSNMFDNNFNSFDNFEMHHNMGF